MGMDADTRTIQYAGVTYRVSLAHPAADVMPWHLDHADFAEMVESMRGGFDPTHPIVRHGDTGRLINGRRRELAATIAGVEPVYIDVRWDDEEITEFVRREDLIRRNLTQSERAAAAVELAALLPRGGDRKSATYADQTAKLRFDSTAEIAEQAGVSQRTVEDVAKVKKEAPELLPAVKEGKLAANVAAKVADLPKKERAKVAASDNPKQAAKEAVAKAAKKAKPEAEPEEKPADPEIVPEHPADVFCGRINRLCRLLDGAKAEVVEIAADPFGKHVHAESVTLQIDAARKALWQSRPTEPCNCVRDGADPHPACKACYGFGRTTASRVLKGGR